MWITLIAIATALIAVAWVPICRHFWRAWQLRGAPLSLAIAGLIGFQIYLNLGTWLFMHNDPKWVAAVVAFCNLLILGNFYLCMLWQRKKFPDARTNCRAPSDADTNPKYRPKS